MSSTIKEAMQQSIESHSKNLVAIEAFMNSEAWMVCIYDESPLHKLEVEPEALILEALQALHTKTVGDIAALKQEVERLTKEGY